MQPSLVNVVIVAVANLYVACFSLSLICTVLMTVVLTSIYRHVFTSLVGLVKLEMIFKCFQL